ncbi:MAG: hypothetical protein CL609_08830 [Anaerolineaceae bacterium]|nr:hypothetical protein [Anaerolineaceae bacterium]
MIENATQEEIKEFSDFITSGTVKQIEPITIKGVKEDGTVDFEDIMDNLDVYKSFLTENKFPRLFEKMMGADTEYFQLESVKGTSKFINSNENYLEFKKQQDGNHNEDLSNSE